MTEKEQKELSSSSDSELLYPDFVGFCKQNIHPVPRPIVPLNRLQRENKDYMITVNSIPYPELG